MPALRRYCARCHDRDQPESDLRLDGYEGLMRGGETGPVVVAGDPEGSLLVAKIERHDRPPMPPRRRLPSAAIARIRAWIAAGAPP